MIENSNQEILDISEEKPQPTKAKSFSLVIIQFVLGVIIALIGALFKIQSWVWGTELTIAGLAILLLALIVGIRKLYRA